MAETLVLMSTSETLEADKDEDEQGEHDVEVLTVLPLARRCLLPASLQAYDPVGLHLRLSSSHRRWVMEDLPDPCPRDRHGNPSLSLTLRNHLFR